MDLFFFYGLPIETAKLEIQSTKRKKITKIGQVLSRSEAQGTPSRDDPPSCPQTCITFASILSKSNSLKPHPGPQEQDRNPMTKTGVGVWGMLY